MRKLLYCPTIADQDAYKFEQAQAALIDAAIELVSVRQRLNRAISSGDFAEVQKAMKEMGEAMDILTNIVLAYERMKR